MNPIRRFIARSKESDLKIKKTRAQIERLNVDHDRMKSDVRKSIDHAKNEIRHYSK